MAYGRRSRYETPGDIRRETVTFADISDAWLRESAGEHAHLPDAYSRAGEGFGGTPHAQMDEYLKYGFNGGEPLAMGEGSSDILVPTLELDEDEGDYVYELAEADEDLYRMKWSDQIAPRGISIEARFNFFAGVPADLITEYASWLLSVVDGVERMGESPNVTIYCRYECLEGPLQVNIPVRIAGETMDIDSWRSLFAPGGFRYLCWLACYIAADRIGWRLRDGLLPVGRPSQFQLAFDEDDSIIDIQPQWSLESGTDYPALSAQIQSLIGA